MLLSCMIAAGARVGRGKLEEWVVGRGPTAEGASVALPHSTASVNQRPLLRFQKSASIQDLLRRPPFRNSQGLVGVMSTHNA